MEYNKVAPPVWVKAILVTAALYSAACGLFIILLPDYLYTASHLNHLQYRFTWEMVGAAELALGMGYFIASRNPYNYWPGVLCGLIFKICTGLIYYNALVATPELAGMQSYFIITSLIWIPALAAVLYKIYRHSFSSDEMMIELFSDERYTLDMFETNEGNDLHSLSYIQPVMLVFLRHFGCTFCRESLQDIGALRKDIEGKGTKIVLVHMLENEDEAHECLIKYQLDDIACISDPECILYKKFKLRKGTMFQLLGPKTWWRGITEGLFKKYAVGGFMGDPSQMPGIFLIHQGEVNKSYIHRYAADRPEYLSLATCEGCL